YRMQFILYSSLVIMLLANVAGFVVYTKDVDNFDDLVKRPELAWLKARGGTLILFGEPGKRSLFMNEIVFFTASFAVFLPPVVFAAVHAMRLL
ncbi:hypothetical protein PFISCL1PPCAC_28562, partial [Pristionchus fissidentatus]